MIGRGVGAACERRGIASTCERCDGHGETWPSPEAKAAHEAWESTEPPAGDGYQMWETVSEGSPISPVFATAAELAAYLVQHPKGADRETSFETWMKFIEGPGWAPSMIMAGGKLMSGVEGVVR